MSIDRLVGLREQMYSDLNQVNDVLMKHRGQIKELKSAEDCADCLQDMLQIHADVSGFIASCFYMKQAIMKLASNGSVTEGMLKTFRLQLEDIISTYRTIAYSVGEQSQIVRDLLKYRYNNQDFK